MRNLCPEDEDRPRPVDPSDLRPAGRPLSRRLLNGLKTGGVDHERVQNES